MRKIALLMVALLALAAVATAATAKPPKKIRVGTELTVKFKEGTGGDGDYYEEGPGDLFFGKVRAKKRCEERRKVRILAANGRRVGKDKTDRRGHFSVRVENAAPGKYYAVVKKRTYKNRKGTRKIICRPAG